jgi:histidinol-phosphatase
MREPTPPWSSDLALALRLADEASRISRSFHGPSARRWTKNDGSPATEADIAVERTVRQRLAVERPGDALLGEEEGQTGTGRRRWILDAIDGTSDFIAGGANWATRGGGAFHAEEGGSSQPLRVSGAATLSSARSYVPPPRWLPDDRARRMARAVSKATVIVPNDDHPALEVAGGRAEIAMFLLGGPWDLAALIVIVEEAGGRFSSVDGRHDAFEGTALFTNGLVHDEMLRVLAGA